MPWEIRREGDEYCVYKQDGERVACHASRRAANRQMRALYASEKAAKFRRYMYNGVTVQATGRRPSSREDKKYERTVRRGDTERVVHYGDPNLEMRRDDPERRANFLSRHDCGSKRDPFAPGFWACLDWARTSEGKKQMSDDMLIMRPTQAEVDYVRLSTVEGQACANCRWFAKSDGGYCHIIQTAPEQILPTGWCNRWEMAPDMQEAVVETEEEIEIDTSAMTDEPMADMAQMVEEMTAPDDEKMRYKRPGPLTVLRKVLGGKSEDTVSGFKTMGDYWFARVTNNFEDREGEIFSRKAIDDYIARVDAGIVPKPKLWLYHVPGSEIGQAEMVARVGNFMVAAGKFSDTPRGHAAKAYFNKATAQTGVSHGFTYDSKALVDGVYHKFNTFEISPLPAKAAANPYTSFDEVKQMNEHKKAFLRKVLGPEQADAVIAETEQASKALEESGVRFKDFIAEHSGDETEAVKEAAAKAEENFGALLADLLSEQKEFFDVAGAAIKAVKALETRIAAQDATIATQNKQIDALRAEMALTPRASRNEATITENTQLKENLEQKAKDTDGADLFEPFPVKK